jgi:hypothetical protein
MVSWSIHDVFLGLRTKAEMKTEEIWARWAPTLCGYGLARSGPWASSGLQGCAGKGGRRLDFGDYIVRKREFRARKYGAQSPADAPRRRGGGAAGAGCFLKPEYACCHIVRSSWVVACLMPQKTTEAGTCANPSGTLLALSGPFEIIVVAGDVRLLPIAESDFEHPNGAGAGVAG